jgi:FkbM family methyltransferase
LKKFLHLLLLTVGYRIVWLAKIVDPAGGARREKVAARRVAEWYSDPRHVTLLYDFPLDERSLALDVGGFEGSWALELLCRHRCHVEVFEPVPEYAERLRRRFAFSDSVRINGFGLGGRDGRLPLGVEGERSSFFHDLGAGKKVVHAPIRDVVGYLDEQGIRHAAVLKLNIEGGEYELLERLIDAGRTSTFDFILVQFHDELADAQARYETIAMRLAGTHERLWRFPFVWESWRLRDPAMGDDA